MRFFECIVSRNWRIGFGPKKGERLTFYRMDADPNFIIFAEYPGVSYLLVFFREIEFPPSLESEIKESLTRELVEV